MRIYHILGKDVVLKRDLEQWLEKEVGYFKAHRQDENYHPQLEELLDELELEELLEELEKVKV